MREVNDRLKSIRHNQRDLWWEKKWKIEKFDYFQFSLSNNNSTQIIDCWDMQKFQHNSIVHSKLKVSGAERQSSQQFQWQSERQTKKSLKFMSAVEGKLKLHRSRLHLSSPQCWDMPRRRCFFLFVLIAISLHIQIELNRNWSNKIRVEEKTLNKKIDENYVRE